MRSTLFRLQHPVRSQWRRRTWRALQRQVGATCAPMRPSALLSVRVAPADLARPGRTRCPQSPAVAMSFLGPRRRSLNPPRRRAGISRLRTAHDSTVRDIVAASWDDGVRGPRSHPREEAVSLVALGGRWALDIVALTHNAVRAELGDLRVVLGGVVSSGGAVGIGELRALFAWFSTFEAFVVTVLKAEEEVLYPWLEQWGRIEGVLGTAGRIRDKGAIIRAVRDVGACAACVGLEAELFEGVVLLNPDRRYYDGLKVGFCELEPGVRRIRDARLAREVVEKVVACVDVFTALLESYFEEEERSLPTIIEALYDVEDAEAARVERRTVRAIWKCGRKDESMVMLMRAFEDKTVAKAWAARNLRRVERFAMPVWRRRFYAGRGAVVQRFRERREMCERNALNAEAPHRGLDAPVEEPNAHRDPARDLWQSEGTVPGRRRPGSLAKKASVARPGSSASNSLGSDAGDD